MRSITWLDGVLAVMTFVVGITFVNMYQEHSINLFALKILIIFLAIIVVMSFIILELTFKNDRWNNRKKGIW